MLLTPEALLDNLPAYVCLWEKAFLRTADPELFRWRFCENPTPGSLVVARSEGEKMIASYAVSPVRLCWHESEISSGLGMIAMVDPAYMGKALFFAVAREATDAANASDMPLIWTYPNSKSHMWYIRMLRWNDVCEIPVMKLDMANAPAGHLEWQCDNGFSLLYDSAGVRDRLRVKKDAAYLRWRYTAHPANDYRNFVLATGTAVLSYCVVKHYQGELDIVDFQPRNESEGRDLLRRVISYARSQGLTSINTWAPLGHFTHGLCEQLRFVHGAPVTYVCMFTADQELQDIAADPRNWFLQMGDSDVY